MPDRLLISPLGGKLVSRLVDKRVWPIAITLAVGEGVKNSLKEGRDAALYHHDGTCDARLIFDEFDRDELR